MLLFDATASASAYRYGKSGGNMETLLPTGLRTNPKLIQPFWSSASSSLRRFWVASISFIILFELAMSMIVSQLMMVTMSLYDILVHTNRAHLLLRRTNQSKSND